MLLCLIFYVTVYFSPEGEILLMNIFLSLGTGFPYLQPGGVGVWGESVLPAPFTTFR